MMKASDMARALCGLAKRNLTMNSQERQLLKDAASRLVSQDAEIRGLNEKLMQATQTTIQEAVTEGKPDEDFWNDDWPLKS
jgi:hypothetical protein